MRKMKVECSMEMEASMFQRIEEEPVDEEESKISDMCMEANILQRSQNARVVKEAAWKHRERYLRKLGFVREEESDPPHFQETNPPVKVDKQHTITAWDPALDLILVDDKHVLPLRADAIGTLLEVDFEGQVPPSNRKHKRLLKAWIRGGATSKEAAFKDKGVKVTCLKPDLQRYIKGRYKTLGWGSEVPNLLPLREAYSLVDEMLSELNTFDWVGIRTYHIRRGLQGNVMSPQYMDFLSRYIREALRFTQVPEERQLRKRFAQAPEGKQQLRRSKRRHDRITQDEEEFATAVSVHGWTQPRASKHLPADEARRKLVKIAGVRTRGQAKARGEREQSFLQECAVHHEEASNPIEGPNQVTGPAGEELQNSTTGYAEVTNSKQQLPKKEAEGKVVEVSASPDLAQQLKATFQRHANVMQQDIMKLLEQHKDNPVQAVTPTFWQTLIWGVCKIFGLPAS